ncbi:MAG: hypothetical protein ACYC2Y_05530 [Armatimonadota bacterium]
MAKPQDQCIQGESKKAVEELFESLWNDLRATLGSAPTSALLRRAIAASRDCCPTMGKVTIERRGRDYSYELPQIDENIDTCRELSRFVEIVLSLLSELTGRVLVRHLLNNPAIGKYAEKR